MKIICTKYTRQGGPGATYNGKRLTDGVVELVDGDNLLNRIYVDGYGHTNYEGDEWSDKLYDEFIVSPTERYRKKDISPIALKEKKHWFESGDLTQDKLKSKDAKETALATIKAFKDSICDENAGIIKDYYLDKMHDAKLEYEKEFNRLFEQMKSAMGDKLLPYAKINFKGFSAPKCVYGRNTKQFSVFESCDYDDFVEDENGKVFKYLRKFETRGPGSKYVIADEEGKEKTVWGSSADGFKKSTKQFASYEDIRARANKYKKIWNQFVNDKYLNKLFDRDMKTLRTDCDPNEVLNRIEWIAVQENNYNDFTPEDGEAILCILMGSGNSPYSDSFKREKK